MKNFIHENSIKDSPKYSFIHKLDIEITTCGYTKNKSCWENTSFYGAPFHRIHFPLHGEFNMISISQTYTVKPGALFFFPSMALYKFNGILPTTHYWIHFCSSSLSQSSFFGKPRNVELSEPERAKVEKTMMAMYRLAGLSSSVKNIIEMRNMFFEILSPFLEKMYHDTTVENIESDNLFSLIQQYIDSRISRDITMEELSSLIQMPRNRFIAEFRRKFDMTPKHFLCLRRLEKAKLLLLRTNDSITDIAHRVGYKDENYFSRTFRKFVLMAPSEYREKRTYL